jgi:predicted glycosyltransferase
MRIVVDINTPGQVHFFKNFVREMEKRGHEILITATKKDVSLDLLDNYGFNYINLGSYGISLIKKLINIPVIDLKMYKLVKDFKPDIFVGFGSIRAAQVSKLMRKTCIAFDDTEHSTEQYILYAPFTNVICTPSCFNKDLGKKQIRFNGYKELAYLHPNYFKPNPAVLDEMGLSKDDKFIILRFVSWTASHDVGQHGINNKIGLVKELEKYGRVIITSEGALPKELETYKIKVSPEKLHDLLYYASLYVGEGATVATEAAVLGTPSIYVSSLVGTMGNFIELEQKYRLIFNYNDSDKAVNKAVELIQKSDLKEEWQKKREKLLKEKIDVTAFMVWFIENYPESF